MKRLFIAGGRDYDQGIARPHCTGSCHGGRDACNCETGETELSLDIHPDAGRVIQPSPVSPEDIAIIARIRRNTLLMIAVCFAVMAALLEMFGAQPFDRSIP